MVSEKIISSGWLTHGKYTKKFEDEFPTRYAQDCFDFMGYSYKEAIEIIDKFRDKNNLLKKFI